MLLSKLLTVGTEAVADSTLTAKDEILAFTEKMSSMSGEEILTWGLTGAAEIVWKLILALLIYVAGKWIIGKVVKLMNRIFTKKNVDISLAKFLTSLTRISLYVILITIVIGILGINTTSFVALFASAGIAVGMALSGTLQNFAGGVLILILKPYRIGDFIEARGYTGVVKEISLFNTLLNTVDNRMIIIPNGELSVNSIINYSKEPVRRVDWTVGVCYGADYDKVKAVVNDLLAKHELILKDHEMFIALHSLGDSSVNIVIRSWCKAENYWTLYFDMNEKIYKRFNDEGIEFPFPQMDVHLKQA